MNGKNLWALTGREFLSLRRDVFLVLLVIYAFSISVYSEAVGISHDLHNAAIAIVDEDDSPLSRRIADSFRPPEFQTPVRIASRDVDRAMNAARYTFVLDIPPRFQADVQAGHQPSLQLLIDATAMMQAGIGANQIENLVDDEVSRYVLHERADASPPVALALRVAFNPTLDTRWFTGVMGIIQNITMLAVLLSGAALIREREHGTLEHLLVMPVRPVEIMGAKILANSAVILVMSLMALTVVMRGILGIPLAGSLPLFLAATALYLFFATALGIFLATLARSMPQLGLLFILIVLPMNLLSGGNTPLESMPLWLQRTMQLSPSTHFTSLAQAILYRGAGLSVVWPQLAAIIAMASLFFLWSLNRFRRHLASLR